MIDKKTLRNYESRDFRASQKFLFTQSLFIAKKREKLHSALRPGLLLWRNCIKMFDCQNVVIQKLNYCILYYRGKSADGNELIESFVRDDEFFYLYYSRKNEYVGSEKFRFIQHDKLNLRPTTTIYLRIITCGLRWRSTYVCTCCLFFFFVRSSILNADRSVGENIEEKLYSGEYRRRENEKRRSSVVLVNHVRCEKIYIYRRRPTKT